MSVNFTSADDITNWYVVVDCVFSVCVSGIAVSVASVLLSLSNMVAITWPIFLGCPRSCVKNASEYVHVFCSCILHVLCSQHYDHLAVCWVVCEFGKVMDYGVWDSHLKILFHYYCIYYCYNFVRDVWMVYHATLFVRA